MIKISKEEAFYIRKQSSTTHVNITSREKSKGKRKGYYMEETRIAMKLINDYRNGIIKE